MQDRFVFANGAIAASWTIFMGQAEHGSDLPWPNLPRVKKAKTIKKKLMATIFLQNY